MAERNLTPPEIADIIKAVEARDPDINVLSAARAIVRAGFLLIGTPESQPVHHPRLGQTYHDLLLSHDVLLEDASVKTLQATWMGSIAVLSAVFGDLNCPEKKRIPEYRFGWRNDAGIVELDEAAYEDEQDVQLHADTRLIAMVKRHGQKFSGAIDIIRHTPSFYFAGETDGYRHGVILTQHSHQTVATLPVLGEDLFLTNIISRDPSEYGY